MKLYFKNSHGEMRVIAEFDSGMTDKEYLKQQRKKSKNSAMHVISKSTIQGFGTLNIKVSK